MNALHPGGGTARALTRRLAAGADRLALYAALSDGGTRGDTMLLETLGGPSLILDQAAVRIECREGEVTLTRLTAGGAAVLATVERTLSHRVAERSADRLVLRFPRIAGDDAEQRLLSPSPFDVLRALTGGVRAETPEEPFTLTLLGVVAFDHVDLFEDLPAPAEDPLGFPDFIFWVAESLVVAEPGLAPRLVCTSFGSDPDEALRGENSAAERLAELAECCEAAPASLLHTKPRSSRAMSRGAGADSVQSPLDCARDERNPHSSPNPPSVPEAVPDLDDCEYAALVGRMKEHVLAGDVYQIVPSRTFRAPCVDAIASFAAVRRLDR
ncbi:MAG TPA: hypothetical protein VGB08_02980, partial [Allosphingosinicella sp.]